MFSVSLGDYVALFLVSCFSVLYYCDLNKDFAVIPVFPLCFVSDLSFSLEFNTASENRKLILFYSNNNNLSLKIFFPLKHLFFCFV